MTTSSPTAAPAVSTTTCPPWCITPRETHVLEWEQDHNTFHRSAASDTWVLDYTRKTNEVAVVVETFSSATEPDELFVTVRGDLSRGSQDLSEFTVSDARRLAGALVAACEIAEAQA